MNRYQREFRQSFQTAVFWLAQFVVCAIASYASASQHSALLAIIFGVCAGVQLLAAVFAACDAYLWHRRDVATRNHYL